LRGRMKRLLLRGPLKGWQEERQNVRNHLQALSEENTVLRARLDSLEFQLSVLKKQADNMPYEIQDRIQKGIKYEFPHIQGPIEAVDKILAEQMSMARFGDGEFEIMAGRSRAHFQETTEKLGARLREVLQTPKKNVLICIANNYGSLDDYNPSDIQGIRDYMTEEVRQYHMSVLDPDRIYYDTYLTRPYVMYRDNQTDAPRKRFENLQRLWDGRDVVFIEGDRTRMGVGNDLFSNVRSVRRILAPNENAFQKYDEILKEAEKVEPDALFLLALGPTATVLAYDLAQKGYQALDIGHIDLEYEWMKAGQGKRVAVNTKYNNEYAGGNLVQEIGDETYKKQIIAKIDSVEGMDTLGI
jgi:glycosyltransferase family protein